MPQNGYGPSAKCRKWVDASRPAASGAPLGLSLRFLEAGPLAETVATLAGRCGSVQVDPGATAHGSVGRQEGRARMRSL